MTLGAVVFMLVSWGLVLGLTAWAFGRILTHSPTPPPAGDATTPATQGSHRERGREQDGRR